MRAPGGDCRLMIEAVIDQWAAWATAKAQRARLSRSWRRRLDERIGSLGPDRPKATCLTSLRLVGRLRPGAPTHCESSAKTNGRPVAGALLYLDSSALVKLVVPEPETKALHELLRSWPERVSSIVTRIEVEHMARRIGGGAIRRSRTVLSRVALVGLDEDVVQEATSLAPAGLRTPNVIHLATVLSLGGDLGALCAYDSQLVVVAASMAIDVLAPA